MTTFLLIRHASTDANGKILAGRKPGVLLNDDGRSEASRLARFLAQRTLDAIYSSPLERARETADFISQATGVPVQIREALAEIQYGEWTNARFDELESDVRWRLFNTFRSGTSIPGGELMLQV